MKLEMLPSCCGLTVCLGAYGFFDDSGWEKKLCWVLAPANSPIICWQFEQ
jgi:hypothetical protein